MDHLAEPHKGCFMNSHPESGVWHKRGGLFGEGKGDASESMDVTLLSTPGALLEKLTYLETWGVLFASLKKGDPDTSSHSNNHLFGKGNNPFQAANHPSVPHVSKDQTSFLLPRKRSARRTPKRLERSQLEDPINGLNFFLRT